MRHRSRVISSTPVVSDILVYGTLDTGPNCIVPYAEHATVNGYNIGHYVNVLPYYMLEEMADVVSTGAWIDHPCTHQKSTTRRYSYSGPTITTKTSENFPPGCWGEHDTWRVRCTHGPLGIGANHRVDLSFVNYDREFNLGEIMMAHLHALKPFYQVISIPNFLYELRDLRRTLSAIQEFFHLYRPEGLVLAHQFGVRPFIDDMIHMLQSFGRISDSVARLRKNEKISVPVVTQRTAFSKFAPAEEIGPTPTRSPHTSRVALKERFSACELTIKIHSRVRYNISGFSDIELTALAAVKAFGFSNPIQVVWNGIPFSFIADWLVPVSEFLGFLDFVDPIIPYSVESTTTHYTARRTSSLYGTFFMERNSPVRVSDEHVLHDTEGVLYHRDVGFPKDLGFLGEFSFREQILSLFLGAQRVRPGRVLYKFPRLRRHV